MNKEVILIEELNEQEIEAVAGGWGPNNEGSTGVRG